MLRRHPRNTLMMRVERITEAQTEPGPKTKKAVSRLLETAFDW